MKVSWRWAKRPAAAALAAVLMAGMLPTEGFAAKMDGGKQESFSISVPTGLKDGVYTGEATVEPSGRVSQFDAYGIQVSVTVANGTIQSIDCTGAEGNNLTYSEQALNGIQDTVSKAGSAETISVDAVSGATCSTKAIVEAVNTALQGEPGEGGTTEPTDTSNISVSSWSELCRALLKVDEGGTIQITQDLYLSGTDYPADAVTSATPEQIAECSKSVTIEGNGHTISADTASSGYCFYFKGTTVVRDLVIDGGKYGRKCGGCMYITGADVTLERVTMKNCQAYNSGAGMGGGAIYLENSGGKGGTSTPGILTAKDCTFENNWTGADGTTGVGGAIYAWNGTVNLENCTFRGNRAYEGGAVAATGNAAVSITNCTFDGNTASNIGSDVICYDGTAPFKHGEIDAATTLTLSGSNSYRSGSIVFARYYSSAEQTASAPAASGVTDLAYGDVSHTKTVAGALKQAISRADGAGEQSVYTSDSWAVFEAARTAAKAIDRKAINKVTTVTSSNLAALQAASVAATALGEAQDALVALVSAEQLNALLAETAAVDDSWFPDRQGAEESREAFQTAYAAAQEAASNSSTTADDRANAYYALKQAYASATNPDGTASLSSVLTEVSLSRTTYASNGKARKPAVTVTCNGEELVEGTDYTVSYQNNVKPGTATVTITGIGIYTGERTETFTILKSQTVKVKVSSKTYKASSLKKASKSFSIGAKAKSDLSYKVTKYPKNAKKYIKVSSKGKVTLKKGAKKGTYKVTVTAAETGTYASATKTITIKVK